MVSEREQPRRVFIDVDLSLLQLDEGADVFGSAVAYLLTLSSPTILTIRDVATQKIGISLREGFDPYRGSFIELSDIDLTQFGPEFFTQFFFEPEEEGSLRYYERRSK